MFGALTAGGWRGTIELMSIIWTLRKYTDAIRHREEEAAQERDRRRAQRQGLGDDEGNGPAADEHTQKVLDQLAPPEMDVLRRDRVGRVEMRPAHGGPSRARSPSLFI